MLQEIKQFSVPWTFLDVAFFFALWLGAQMVSAGIVAATHASSPSQAPVAAETEGHQHPIERLVQKSQNAPMILLVAFLSVVVAAPLIEEFLFRLLFQGWLESKLLQLQIPYADCIAVVAVSFCFAAIHAGSGRDLGLSALFYLLVSFLVLNLLIFTFGILYLVRMKSLTMTENLFGTERFFRPGFFRSAGYCLLVILLCFGLNAILNNLFPATNTDPIPIFFFSLVLGTLYSQTKNLSYSILLHACLNGMSFLVLLWHVMS